MFIAKKKYSHVMFVLFLYLCGSIKQEQLLTTSWSAVFQRVTL